MAQLQETMPDLCVGPQTLKRWGRRWLTETYSKWKVKGSGKNRQLSRATVEKKKDSFDKFQAVNFCNHVDMAFGRALAIFLGGIPVRSPASGSLLPPIPDCVEVGAVRVVGGIRPQNYDAAYRPDGPRVVLDSKSLNDAKSIGKNWQNMINDLATESATIHTRFPYAIVTFVIMLPKPALGAKQRFDIIRTLERLGARNDVLDQHHLAEAIALVIWNPDTGEIDPDWPPKDSNVSIINFSAKIARCYTNRYKGLPPHAYDKGAPRDDVELFVEG